MIPASPPPVAGLAARPLVQPIDVLGEQPRDRAAPLEFPAGRLGSTTVPR